MVVTQLHLLIDFGCQRVPLSINFGVTFPHIAQSPPTDVDCLRYTSCRQRAAM